MKPLLSAILALGLAATLRAQDTDEGGPPTEYAPEQLDQLVAPIALYPDPLVALMLPAATAPSDISLAAQYLSANGDPTGIDSQPWQASVKGLAHYPSALIWMNNNPDWTSALGAAFAMQPSDVMKSIQQMRAKAQAAGTLVNTPQQQVETDGDDIRIVPTQDDTIYAPQYDPEVVYDVPDDYSGPFITFGAGYPVGAWLGFECDWDDFGIWTGPWRRGWAYRRDWRDAHSGGRTWHPDPRRGHELVRSHFRPAENPPAPRPVLGAARPGRAVNEGPRPMARPMAAPVRSRPDYRGYANGPVARPSSPAPASPLFGGYGRGTEARDNSARGHQSRTAPVRAPARPAPARSAPGRSAPAPAGRDRDRH